MKKSFFCMLTLALLSFGFAEAQTVLLPFGQFTQQPWSASYFYALNNGDKPADNWFAKDFDDSAWGTLEGPISTKSGISYYVTPWADKYSTYWVRRHFSVNDIKETPFVYLYLYHDDGCEVYLNGWQLYNNSNYYTHLVTVAMTQEMCSHFVEGDNVIAVKVSDTRGGEAFMDFGIEANNVPPLANPNFDNGYDGWSWSGDGLYHGGQSFNYLSRYLTNNPFDAHQTVNATQKGLFRIRAQAFEAFDDYNAGWENYNNTPVSSYLYADNSHHKVKNVFDEALNTNIYRSNEFYRTYNDTYVPTYMTSVSIAFQNGMYENEFYAYIDTTVFDLGIAQAEQLEMERWVCFDNFRIEYIGEKALTSLIGEIEDLSVLPMENDYRDRLSLLLTNLKSANGYESKGKVLSDSSDDFVNAKNSSLQYAAIKDALDALQCRLDTGTCMSEATIAEAKDMIAATMTKYSKNTIKTSECQDILAKLNELNTRLNYIYLDINITVPGSLGDSILSKVENFVDVKSIKISGTLNDADLSTIQSRLSQLREIDMTDAKMTTLPNRFFYQRSLLEIVKLPTQLTTIGEYAFYQCYGIRNIDFPTTLTTINRYGFSECDNLKEVILPEGLISMGEGAFYSCDNNKYVKLPSTLTSISSYAFYYNLNLRNVEFAEGLTHIYNDAFQDCHMLNNLKFPSTLYYIGVDAFAYNRSLSDIEFNEGLFQIGDNAFYDCDALTEVTLPSSLVLANASPFDYCDNLVKVTCLSIEPPYMTDQIPYGLGMSGRELYVPALSVNTYKQTSGWDKFPTIKPIDYLPENIAIRTELHLTLPENIPADYKPNVELLHAWDPQYGCLTVNGTGTLSMSDFKMMYDPNHQHNNYNRNLNYCSLVNNSHLRADQITIDVYPRNDRWTFITMPFDVKVSDIETFCDGSTNWVIRRYDGQKRANGETSETWVKLGNDDVLNAGEGYIIQSSRYIGTSWQDYSGIRMKAVNNTNKNNIFRTTDITVKLNEYECEFAHNRSWNLIGNPYPCYYDTRFMDFEAPITVWNMRNNTYEAYSPVDDSYILCPGEAFFVQRAIDKGNIVFSKDGRQTNRDVRAIEAHARANVHRVGATDSPRTIVNLSLSNGINADRTRIVLNGNATLQYEMDKDASKFMSTDAIVPQIYTSFEGVNYSINERPFADGTVGLSVYIGKEGLNTITLTNEVEGFNVVLEDKALNKKVVLNRENGYTFSAEAGTYTSRFVLHFNNETTGIENIPNNIKEDADIYYSIEGVKMTTPAKKGIYIQNGKKILLNK